MTAPTVCERCITESAAHVVVLDGLDGVDYGDAVQFWGDDCLDDAALAGRYVGHRPLRVGFDPDGAA